MTAILVIGLILALIVTAVTIPALMLSSKISAAENRDNRVE